ncbi:MAG: glycosyl transferase [Rickettsiales bacterium]|nr:glycosyl transferase [Rickettsiales bacterium]|tara:strand:+ start:4586 stop:5359 length:774 start_codon:yes stop_codon:yes gene_type:complete
MPTLSIITVVYNAKTDLHKTLEELKQQQFTDFELIIIDGGSTDGTLDIIKDYNDIVSYTVSEPDNGIYDAMNKGIKAAKGDWITFLNAGDFYVDQDRLATIFSNDLTQKSFVYGDMFLLTETEQKVRYLKAETLTKKSIAKGMIACHQAMFIRREKCPSYRNDLRYQGDLNWVMDILHGIDEAAIFYINKDIVYFKAGGFSDHTILQQLIEHLALILERYSFFTLIILIPRLLRRYLGKWLRKWLTISTFRFWLKSK